MTSRPERKAGQKRGSGGRYTTDPKIVERDARAAEMYKQDIPFKQIAKELGIGLSTAYQAVERAMERVIRQPAEAAIEHSLSRLARERARLEDLRATVERLLDVEQLAIAQGRVVEDNGTPVVDHEYQLKVADRLLKIDEQLRRNDESQRKLQGLDATTKIDIKVTDQLAAEIEDLVEQMASLDAQEAQQLLAKERG